MTAVPHFVLATRSTHKAAEIQDILADTCRLITLDDAAVPYSTDEEDIEVFDTFRENAIAKARFFLARTRRPAIADDSGIMLDALGGAPGVRSRRFAARPGLDGRDLDLANNALVAQRLSAVPEHERTAHYLCAAAVAYPDGSVFTALGSCSGFFVMEPRGGGGFGYDPHFLLREEGRTFGELTAQEKHRFSHRARAFRALSPYLH